VDYANEVLARAIGWGQRRFCINCTTDPSLRNAVDAAWGAPVRATITPVPKPKPKAKGKPAPKGAAKDPKALAASKRG
jgi:hypothetical protein